MIDKYLSEKIKENAPGLLAILKAHGVDVEKFEQMAQTVSDKAKNLRNVLSEEQKELNRQKREKRKEEKTRQEETARFLENDLQAERALYQINAFKDIVDFANYELKKQAGDREKALTDLKRIAFETSPGEMEKEETLINRKEKETINPELKTKRLKAEFMRFYAKEWFFILLDLINQSRRYYRKY